MTTDTQTSTALDPRTVFGRALNTTAEVIALVGPERLGDGTPCPDFTVRDLLGHLVSVVRRVTQLGRGEDPFSSSGLAAAAADVADDDWADAWASSVAGFDAVWADDAVLERVMTLPWMTGPGGQILIAYLSEITVHTWDLAKALGVAAPWDEQVLSLVTGNLGGMPATGRSEVFAAIKAGMPEQYRSGPDPFLDAVPVADDAPAIDRIVAWHGRRPDWSA